MKRRSFLQVAVAGIASAAASSVALGRSTKGSGKAALTADVIVLGAGTFGAWTAYQLRKSGASVLLADGHGAGNQVGAAGGHTRTMRVQYGTRTVYARLAMRAAELWSQYQKEWREELLLPSERVRIWPAKRLGEAKEEQGLLAGLGVEMRILDASEARKQWPQIAIQDEEIVIHTTGQAGTTGILLAAKSGGVAVRQFERLGGKFVRATASSPAASGRIEEVVLSNGQRLSGGHYVFACGQQLAELFPDLVGKRAAPQRRIEYYIELPPQGADHYMYPRMPLWGFNTPDWYGYPSVEGTGFKLSHVYTEARVDEALAFVKRRFPALPQKLKSLRVCHDLYTPDTDFIIDSHPGQDNVWIAGGGSGHGFKHGPALGEHIAAKVLGKQVDTELDARCRWKSV